MSVSNVMQHNITNRTSPMQQAILLWLKTQPQSRNNGDGTQSLGALPRTGDIVDALGRGRDKAGFAAVSRSLDRMRRAGLVEALRPSIQTRGNGNHWQITEAGIYAANSQRPVSMSVATAAKLMNVSESTVYAARRFSRLASEQGRPDLVAAVEAGSLSLNAALHQVAPPPVKGAALAALRRSWAKATDIERRAFLRELGADFEKKPAGYP